MMSRLKQNRAHFLTANSGICLERWLAGLQATYGVAMMFGIHGAEKVGGGFVMWLFLATTPVLAQAVAEAAEHTHDQHRMGQAHPTKVVVMGHIQALVQPAFDAPRGAVVLEPLGGVEFFGRQAGDQGHDFRAMVAQMAPQ